MFSWKEIFEFFKDIFNKVVLSWPWSCLFSVVVLLVALVTHSVEAQTALMTFPDGASLLI